MSALWRRTARHSRRSVSLMLAGLALLLAACGDRPAHDLEVDRRAPVLLASTATNQVDQFVVTGLDKVSEKRIARTIFEYGFRVSIKNVGAADAVGVTALVNGAGPGSDVIVGQAVLASIRSGETVASPDLIVVRHDRTVPFAPNQLHWQILDKAGLRLNELNPAETYTFSLKELGIPAAAENVTVSGAIDEALIRNGTLRFSTPGDTGTEQFAVFEIRTGAIARVLLARIRSSLPTRIALARDEDALALPASLVLDGVGPGNRLTGSPLTFKLSGTAGLKLAHKSDALILLSDGKAISVKPYWKFDPQDQSFSIGGDGLTKLLEQLPVGRHSVMAAFVSDDAEFVANFEFTLTKASARVRGRFILPDGRGATELSGRKVLLKGFNGGLRMHAAIAADGTFVFDGIIPDIYYITLSDLEHPGQVAASTSVLPVSGEVNVTLVYGEEEAAPAVFDKGAGAMGPSKQSALRFPPRQRLGSSATRAMQSSPAAGATAKVFSVSSGEENVLSSMPIDMVMPKGTQSVKVVATVASDEYPQYSTQHSDFDDTWSYQVTGIPEQVSGADSVNRSHVNQGWVYRSVCVDVSEQAKDAPLSISGSVKATNIGDSQFPTTTSVEISYPCTGLKVTSATFLSPNADGHPILQPVHTSLTGNLAGPYLSVPQSSSSNVHTVPLEIRYFPADAEIDEVTISIGQGAGLNFATENLLSQTHTIANGKITFPRLKLPVSTQAKGSGIVNVLVRIQGRANGKRAASDPTLDGAVGLNHTPFSFTPLFPAGEEAALAGRRFGQPEDTGGDSWATFRSIGWAMTKPYRFNDISGPHIAQANTGHSLLGHAGHSDGQQIDLRYADGAGGFSEMLGGANDGAGIRQMLLSAKAEISSNASLKPQLLRLQAWISANRTMIDAEAATNGTRIIYIGKSFISLALVDGRFSSADGDTIPGVLPWQRSPKIQTAGGHLNHWHLSVTQHP